MSDDGTTDDDDDESLDYNRDEDDDDKDGEDVSKEGSNSDTCSDGLEDVVIDDGSFDCEQQVVDGNTSPDDSAMKVTRLRLRTF